MSFDLRARAPPIFLPLTFGLPLVTITIDPHSSHCCTNIRIPYHSVLRFVSMIGSCLLFFPVLLVLLFVISSLIHVILFNWPATKCLRV